MLESSRRWEWIAGEGESARRVNFDPTKKFGIGPSDFRRPVRVTSVRPFTCACAQST